MHMNKEAAMAFEVKADAGEELTEEMIGALNTNQSVRHVWVFGFLGEEWRRREAALELRRGERRSDTYSS